MRHGMIILNAQGIIVSSMVVIGPITDGGIQASAFKISDTAGTIDNIIHCKLYRFGSVGFDELTRSAANTGLCR
ncbi:hypothetical protein JHK85_010743 [Glycine max]|nr:hypothetical protein JHK85_010743 [Glycine max]